MPRARAIRVNAMSNTRGSSDSSNAALRYSTANSGSSRIWRMIASSCEMLVLSFTRSLVQNSNLAEQKAPPLQKPQGWGARKFSFAENQPDQPLTQSSGSIFTTAAPWLLPVQIVAGVVESSAKTRRMLVSRGIRYSITSPVLGLTFSRRSVVMPPV